MKLPKYLLLILNVFGILSFFYTVFLLNYGGMVLCALFFILFYAFYFFERYFFTRKVWLLRCLFSFFLFCSIILGEVFGFYVKLSYWDDLMHFVFGVFSGMFLLFIFKSYLKCNVSTLFVCTFVFSISVTLSVFWEFFEFGMDRVFSFDMQKDKIFENVTSLDYDISSSSSVCYSTIYTDSGVYFFDGILDIGLFDTMVDMFFNMCGIFCGMFWFRYSVKV